MDDQDLFSEPPEVCKRCDNGWVFVTASYGARMFPVKQEDNPEDITRKRAQQAAAQNTVYPCKTCKPELFRRWAELHLDAEHEWWDCEDCKALPGRKLRL